LRRSRAPSRAERSIHRRDAERVPQVIDRRAAGGGAALVTGRAPRTHRATTAPAPRSQVQGGSDVRYARDVAHGAGATRSAGAQAPPAAASRSPTRSAALPDRSRSTSAKRGSVPASIAPPCSAVPPARQACSSRRCAARRAGTRLHHARRLRRRRCGAGSGSRDGVAAHALRGRAGLARRAELERAALPAARRRPHCHAPARASGQRRLSRSDSPSRIPGAIPSLPGKLRARSSAHDPGVLNRAQALSRGLRARTIG
jgi:hypothetical protein